MADDQTMRDRETYVRRLVERTVSEKHSCKHEVHIEAINSEGANYTSVLFLITLKFQDRDDMKLFAKVASVGDGMRDILDAGRLYYLEGFFYTKLAPIYRSLEAKSGVGDEDKFVYPEFFACDTKTQQEVLILEDLVARGYNSYDRFESIDWEHAAASVEALAKLHALSFAYQRDRPEEFKEVCKNLVFMRPKKTDRLKEFWKRMVVRNLSLLPKEHAARVGRCLEQLGEDSNIKFRVPEAVTVIAHGDYRASNLMYKKEGERILTIPVDYQTIHAGCPISDLIYYEMMGSDQRFRTDHHQRLLDSYHRQLGAALQRLDIDVDEVYPRALMDQEMRAKLPHTLVLAMSVLPIVLVDPSEAPTMDGDSCIDDIVMPVNERFVARFRGIVEDLVLWGVI